MNRLAEITLKSMLSSGFALGLALLSLFSSAAKAADWDYSMTSNGIDSFDSRSITPLMTFKLSATTHNWNNDSLDINASYTGLAFSANQKGLTYKEISTDFNIKSPLRALDFSDAIRERCQLSPEKIIDKMIIDGAIGFNLNW